MNDLNKQIQLEAYFIWEKDKCKSAIQAWEEARFKVEVERDLQEIVNDKRR